MFSGVLESSGRVRAEAFNGRQNIGYISAAGEPRKYFAVI
jgi:hypothetical protein